jgi:hypothetical protein
MKKLNRELRHKYAYNINDSAKGKIVSVGSGKDFMRLNRGFYDDIENNDLSIKYKQKLLQKIKNDSLKEFVFTNKQIPEKWKKKLGYQTDVIKLLAKDNNFLYYVARGGGPSKSMLETASTKMYTNDNFNKTNASNISGKIQGLKTCNSQIFPKIKNRYISEDKTSVKNESININDQPQRILEEEDNSNNENTKILNSPSKLRLNKKEIMTEKDIINLLEEFKLAYPIKLDKEEPEEIVENIKKKEKNLEKMDNMPKKNLLFSRTYNASSSTLQVANKYNPFVNIHKLKAKRQRVFRQNIFNNLIPPKKKKMSNSISMIDINSNGKLQKIKDDKKEEKIGPFLNFDYESFYKRVKINDPAIERQLENINFYGPYYSYCPPCLNRNLEYYNHLEPNQCLKLIKYIRKMRGKKILNIKENTSMSSNDKQSNKNLNFINDNINDNTNDNINDNINDNETIAEKGESELSNQY